MRKRQMLLEYKEYMMRQQQSPEQDFMKMSMSKRMTRYIEKKRETSSKSPVQEPNIYATKQRYKYSVIPKPALAQVGYNQVISHSARQESTGYILKTDPMKQLQDRELQKLEY